MADRKNYNTYVYKTEKGTKGNKYHYYSDCRYIKDKSIKRVLKNDARKDKLTLCSECRKKANNHEHQNFGFKKFKSENIAFNNIHDKVLSNIKEEEDKQKEESKYTISSINLEFSDFLSISNSFAKTLKKSFPFEEKNSMIKFNNINNLININQKGMSNIKNNNIILNNNINNEINKNISFKKLSYNNKILFKEEEKKEDVTTNEVKDNIIINLNKNSKNQNSLLIKNKIRNYSFNINNQQNNSSSNNFIVINKINITSRSKSVPKSNSIHPNQKNQILIDSKNFNSLSISNIKTINKNNIINLKENNIINNINKINEKGNYCFSLKILPKKKNDINIDIVLGFEIELFCEENNSDIILNQESSEFSEDIIIAKHTDNRFFISEHLKIRREYLLNVLIDIIQGKLIIMENEDIKNNLNKKNNKNIFNAKNNMLSVSSCKKFSLDEIKEVNPYLKYNKNDLIIVDILFNGKPFYL